MPGTYNGFQNPPTVLAFVGPQADGGKVVLHATLPTRIYRTTVKVSASGGDISGGNYTWLFTSGPGGNQYANKWAGGSVLMNQIINYTYNTGSDNSVSVANDNYYTVVFRDNGYASTQAAWFSTTSEPVKISSVERSSADVYPLMASTITATLNNSLPNDQFVYLRYSGASNYSESVLIKMTVTGTTATAQIPANFNTPSKTVYYYVFTSNIDGMTSLTSDLNLKLLEYNNNNTTGGYTYIVKSAYTSTASNGWTNGATWDAETVPPNGVPVIIGASTTVALNGGTVNVSSLTINGTLVNNAALIEVTGMGQVTVSETGAYTDVSGTLEFLGYATLNGDMTIDNLEINGGLDIADNVTVDNVFQLNAGSYIDGGAIIYAENSTLRYNTGGPYTMSDEWKTGLNQPGVPYNVEINNGTSLSYASEEVATSRSVRGSLTISAGSSFALGTSPGADLQIGGNFTNSGTFTHNNRAVELNGDALQTIQGVTSLAYLTVDNSDLGISIQNDLTVTALTNGLKMISGNINMNGNLLSLSENDYATMEYTSGIIIGKFRRSTPVPSLAKQGGGDEPNEQTQLFFPVGTAAKYCPLTISFTIPPGSGNLITTEFIDGVDGINFSEEELSDGEYFLNRRSGSRWKCDGANLSGNSFDISLKISPFTGIENPAEIRIIHSSDGQDFNISGTHVNGDEDFARRSNVPFSTLGGTNYFYIASNSEDNELPVELASFSATVKKARVDLRWETSNEVQSSQFKVERKTKNSDWESIAALNAAGYSNSVKKYEYKDAVSNPGIYVYRLKMIDNDGTYSYSGEVEVEIDMPEVFLVSQNYPNPFNPETRIDYSVPENARVVFELYGITGEKIATLLDEYADAGFYIYNFNPSMLNLNLSSGMYLLKVTMNAENSSRTFSSVKKLTLLK